MDFTNIKDKKEIYNKLGAVNRQVGLYGGKFFEPFQIYNFMIIVSCVAPEENTSQIPKWTPQQLAKLRRITGYDKVRVKIMENDKGSKYPMITKTVNVNSDKRFKTAPWKQTFNIAECEAVINPNILVEVIRFCQIISKLQAFL